MLKILCAASVAALSFSSLACGNSPLFNHDTASPVGTSVARNEAPAAPAAGECPIALPKSGLCASLTWDTALSTEAENRATLRFWDKATGSAAGPYRDAAGDVAVQLWMPAMGHGSSPVTVAPQGAGVYSASQIYFIMPGAWDVRVQIKQNHQIFEQAILPVML